MNKKILYINLDFYNYKNKTLAQLESFQKFGYLTDLFFVDNNIGCLYSYICGSLNKHKVYNINQNSKISKHKSYENSIIDIVKSDKYDFIYIRRIGIPIIFYNLKKIRQYAKIVYELPTYPFDKTEHFKYNLLQKIENIYLMKFAKKNICFFSAMLQDSIINDKILSISNGVLIEKYDFSIRKEKKKDPNKLNMVGIAHLNYWHGYDRIILAVEKGTIDAKFTIYSNETEERQRLIKIVNDKGLNDRIRFIDYDRVNNWMLEINKYDVAIGGIGYYRRNAKYDTSIKNKEYCAMGIPFVYCCPDLSFPEDFPFNYLVPASDEEIDLIKINEWLNILYMQSGFSKEMFGYAKKQLTFDNSIKKIVKRIEEGE